MPKKGWKSYKNRSKIYKSAPEDSRLWKCNWLGCINGVGLAGNGWCCSRGNWADKNCIYFESVDIIKGA
jgi:hypothetical protein